MPEFKKLRNTWSPKLSDSPHLSQFADELTSITEEIKEMPYGLMGVVIMCIEKMRRGAYRHISVSDAEMFYRAYYMVMGILMTQEKKQLNFSDRDVAHLDDVIAQLVPIFIVLETALGGGLEAELKDGVWNYRIPGKIQNV